MLFSRRIKKILGAILLVVLGIVMIVFSVCVINNTKNTAFVETPATITRIDTEWVGDESEHHVFVKYTYEGEDYSGELGSFTTGMKEGKEITILVDSENPTNIQDKNTGKFMYIVTILGAVVILLGIWTALKAFR